MSDVDGNVIDMRASHNPKYIEFITRLRRARKAQHISQQSLAESLGKFQSFVSKVETCERRIDLIEAAEWCLALNIPFDEVMPLDLKDVLVRREETSLERTDD
jgi:transcriptional regulator with XRE-family HTH domain